MDMYISRPSSDDRYFYIETQEKLFNMLNRKKLIKLPDL